MTKLPAFLLFAAPALALASAGQELSDRCMELAGRDHAAAMAMASAELARGGPNAAHMLVCRGFAQEQAGQNDLALADFDKALGEARRTGDTSSQVEALAMRGQQYSQRGLYADAIGDLKAAYELALSDGNVRDKGAILNAIANVYSDRNVRDYDSALHYYRQVLAQYEASGERKDQATALYNIGVTYESMDKLPEALGFLQRALKIDRELGVATDIAYDQKSVAVVLSKLGRHDEALRLLDNSFTLYGAKALPENIATLRLARGVALRRAGRHAAALQDIDAARGFFSEPPDLRQLETVHDERAQVLAALGDWREAYAARSAYETAHDKLQQQLLDERTARLRVQFDSGEQKRELVRQHAQARDALQASERVRRWQLGALVLGAVALLALVAQLLRQRRRTPA